MPKIDIEALLPYPQDETELTKAQGWVLYDDKEIVLRVLPLRGVYSLMVQSIFKQVADYIRSENLTYSSDDQRKLLAFITNDSNVLRRTAANGAVGNGGTHNDTRSAAGVRKSTPRAKNKPTQLG